MLIWYDTAILLLEIYPPGTVAHVLQETCRRGSVAVLFILA